MQEAGIDPARMAAATPRASTVALGGELLGEVLGRADIEALFCCNDDLALGALFECQRRGIRIPEDLAIIGFNDLEFCASAYPALSSVAIAALRHGKPRRRDRARDHPRFRRAPGSAPDRHGLFDRGTGEHVTRPGVAVDTEQPRIETIMPAAGARTAIAPAPVPDG